MTVINIATPRVFLPLLEPSRYKGLWGGRGAGRSHFFAELLTEHSLAEKGLRSVCIREVQKSLKDSAKLLIEDKISKWPNCGFKVFSDRIQTPGDGIIIFNGMKDHNAASIKSLEGFKRCLIEEAQTITEHSLMLLRPTIRETGSEIWAAWNPVRETDPIDKMLRGPKRTKNSIVIGSNWDDNPFFPSVLEEERLECLQHDPDMYEHIWEGAYATMNKGAYYAAALTLARSEGRISKVAADPLMTKYAVWDIGGTGKKADAVAIWIVQFIGKEIRILDYYEAKGQELSCHVGWLRENDYDRAHCILPHDGVQHDKVYDVTYESALISAGFKVDVIENQGQGAAMARIQAARRLFPSMWFDEEKTKAGVDGLSWYHEKIDPVRQIGLGPDHDWSSNPADAFGLIAIAHSQLGRTVTPRRPFQQQAMP